MADGKPYSILSAVKTALEGINGAGSYNWTVPSGHVHLGLQSLERMDAGPNLELDAAETEHDYSEGASNTLTTLTCFVRGSFHAGADDDVPSKQWQLVKDIITALTADRTLGLSYVYDVKYRSTSTDAGLEPADGFPRTVVVEFDVDYEHEHTEF